MNVYKRAVAAIAAILLTSVTSVASASQGQAPNFAFKDMHGRQHQFSEYRGKWVIVNYWATYCGPCVSELPALNTIAKRYRNEVVVLGMEAGETPVQQLKQFAAQKGLSYPVIPTQDSTMYSMGLIYGVPTTIIVDPHGKIIDTHMGAVSAAQLQRYIRGNQQSDLASDKNDNCSTGIC